MLEPTSSVGRKVLKVSELVRYLKYVVEDDEQLRALAVEGEVCNFSRAASGHVYFSLKDAKSQVQCVLWRKQAMAVQEDLRTFREGLFVVVSGAIQVYEARGAWQIAVEKFEAQGQGALAQRFERLKAGLERQGFFAPERKRPLPPFPRCLALITAPRSQAYNDVLHRLRVQYPICTVIEVGVSVQGSGAADEIAMAIDVVNRLTDAEIILLVRGGGAPEELQPFNEERLVRAIFTSRLPVVTGVGHEGDRTLVDLVADKRSATPSLAAAESVPNLKELVRRMGQLDQVAGQAVRRQLAQDRQRLQSSHRTMVSLNPVRRLELQRKRTIELRERTRAAMTFHLRGKRARSDALRKQLEALDPLAVLARGFAILTDAQTGAVVGSKEHALTGRVLRARVADGEFRVRVEPS